MRQINNQIRLPQPSDKGSMSLEEAIARRRSIRTFIPGPISQSQLSQLLQATSGVNDTSLEHRNRTVPSAGATYPLEIFVLCGQNNVEGIDEGVYHYNVDSHSLTLHRKGDARSELAEAIGDKESIYQDFIEIVICAEYERTTGKYGGRGERFVHIEVGHAGQNIYLQATALGLGTFAIGGFDDEQVRKVLRLDRQYRPLYIMPVGRPG